MESMLEKTDKITMEKLFTLEETCPINHIFEFLWWKDVAAIRMVSKSANEVSKRSTIAHCMFQKLLSINFRCDDIETEVFDGNEDTWALLARRISSWPKSVDIASLKLVPRNVRIVDSQNIDRIQEQSNNGHNSINRGGGPLKADCCVVYEGRKKESHKGSAVVTSDDHFPCLPGVFTQPQPTTEGKLEKWERLPLVEMQKKKKEGVVNRTMAPFTRICRVNAPAPKLYAYLSCVAYFEVDVLQSLGYSAMDEFRRFSLGLACSLFPLRKKQLGSDQHSFGYHREGSLMHGCRKFAQMPPYSPGDTIGCGLVYPPLSPSPMGKIFFTKNGQLVGMFNMSVETPLSLPWFPAMGLAPSIPMEFNFGVHRNFVFNLSLFETNLITEIYPGCGWEHYLSIAAEQEMNLRPTKYAMHPLYFDFFAVKRMAPSRSMTSTMAGMASPVGSLSSPGRPQTHGGLKAMKTSPSQSHSFSLYLDSDLRSATWLGLNDTRRVTFQGSDASWEESAEGDGDEGDDEGDDTASENHDGFNSDSMQVSGGEPVATSCTTQGNSLNTLKAKQRQPRGQMVSVLRNTGSGDNGAVAMDSVMMPPDAVNDLYPGVSEKTGLRRGSGAIAREEHNTLYSSIVSAAGSSSVGVMQVVQAYKLPLNMTPLGVLQAMVM